MKAPIIAVLVLSLAACATTDPHTGEQKTNNTSKGAIVGAIAGAAIGVATASKKDRKKGALTGAVVGGAAGAGVGQYMDRQEAVLRQKLEATGVRVQREGDNLRLIMPGNITFASGQADIRSDFYPVLDSIIEILNKFQKTAIEVSGYTDSTGGYEMNQILSEDRAKSVRTYLIQSGVKPARTQALGYGPRFPLFNNDTAAGRQANRRVELRLLPM